jgi:XRE family transcriptional regulator, fatty acid utilization regulator
MVDAAIHCRACVQLGKRLRDLRLGLNYSQTAVAADLCLAPATLSSYERGTRSITVNRLMDLAAYYDIQVSDLVAGL